MTPSLLVPGVSVALVDPSESDIGDWTIAGSSDGRISLVRLEEMGQVDGEPWYLRRSIDVPVYRVLKASRTL